jgi:hypothetical protein
MEASKGRYMRNQAKKEKPRLPEPFGLLATQTEQSVPRPNASVVTPASTVGPQPLLSLISHLSSLISHLSSLISHHSPLVTAQINR